MINGADISYWWHSLLVAEKFFLIFVAIAEVYLIGVRKNPTSFIIGALLLLSAILYFTSLFGFTPQNTAGTLQLEWTKD